MNFTQLNNNIIFMLLGININFRQKEEKKTVTEKCKKSEVLKKIDKTEKHSNWDEEAENNYRRKIGK